MKRRVAFLFLLLLLSLFFWSAVQQLSAVAPSENPPNLFLEPPTTVIINCKKITFLGVQYNPGDTSTWSYFVEELPCGSDLGGWMVELPGCTIPVSGTPDTWQYVNPDPNYLMTGIKWDVEGSFEDGLFTVTIDGHWAIGTTQVGVKGPTIGIGLLAGPECVLPSPTPTYTPQPPTATPAVTATNTPHPPTTTPSATATNMPPPPTSTPGVTATSTLQQPTTTPSVTPTNTPQPPTPTPPQPTVTATQPGPTMTAEPTMPPSFSRNLMPVVFYNHSPGEPNNSCPNAFNIFPNRLYDFYANDSIDWYTFVLADAGSLTVRVDNFMPLAGQVAVYRGDDCGNLLFLGSNGDFNTTKIVALGAQPGGRFFIFVSNDGSPDTSTPYQLQAQLAP